MGAIQNSLLGMLGAIAGGTVRFKYIKQQAEQLKSSELQEQASLQEQIPQLEAGVQSQEEAVKEAEIVKGAVEKGYVPETLDVDVNAGTYAGPQRLSNIGFEHDKLKAMQALRAAQGVLEGKQAQLDLKKKRFEELSKKYGGNE